jgi:hypothetical protein
MGGKRLELLAPVMWCQWFAVMTSGLASSQACISERRVSGTDRPLLTVLLRTLQDYGASLWSCPQSGTKIVFCAKQHRVKEYRQGLGEGQVGGFEWTQKGTPPIFAFGIRVERVQPKFDRLMNSSLVWWVPRVSYQTEKSHLSAKQLSILLNCRDRST